ncbi:hypothetical protein [Microbacterium sp. 2FI]|uniref:hypothetical protein n=1 Tax=Microbacterium sp. 2FI TaxID=2502193 RepID=UPI0010F65CCE|nr:hypothetical protein [Microbacterium sp. 2FI]
MPYMLTNSLDSSAASGFRIKRTLATIQGQQSATDTTVAAVLDELDGLLKKAIIASDGGAAAAVVEFAQLPLTPRRAAAVGVGRWANDSLARKLKANVPGAGERTFAEFIDASDELTDLRYAFDAELETQRGVLDFNIRAVLDRSGIRDLVFIRATQVYGIRQAVSLMNFAKTHAQGAKDVVAYAAVSAAREVIDENSLQVPHIPDDNSAVVKALRDTPLMFTAAGFSVAVLEAVKGELDDAKYDDLIVKSGVVIPPDLRPRLISFLKSSPVTLTDANAQYMVPMYLAKAVGAGPAPTTSATDPFAVTFYGDDTAAAAVNQAAVKCAAQLFYVMTLGDELGVYDAVRYFTDTYLFTDGLAVKDPVLRKDLEDYVFSNRFPVIDPSTGQTDKVDVTREPLRKAYYRQVFNSGSAPTAGDAPVNEEFGRLWKILILESARYLERAQVSPHPDNFVSRQNVMQAVEDLQYNLSTSCVGLATVMTPLMNAELDFLISRIFGHPEIRSHIVPSGGSWLKVIEKLATSRGKRARVSVLNNKARLGYTLINQIAGYTAWTFEQDEPFSQFISNVDAFITTQSIIQEDGGDDEGGSESSGSDSSSGMPGMSGMPDLSNLPGMPSGLVPAGLGGSNGAGGSGLNGSGSNGSAPADDWDF